MLHDLADLPIISTSFLLVAALSPVVALVLLAVIARRARRVRGARARDPRRSAAELVLAAGLGALAGLALAWVLGDVLDLFGVVLSLGTRGWTAAGGMGLGVAFLAIVRSRRSLTGVGGDAAPPRRLRVLHAMLAVIVVPLVVLASALGINADLQLYPNFAAAFGLTRVNPLDLASLPSPDGGQDPDDASTPVDEMWSASTALPARGRLGSVTIPGTASGFAARDALVYLPPAALVPDAPELPVLIAMSGQPGSPLDMFASGRLDRILGDYAHAHDGLTPIVVVPDQLGAPEDNPMCVDSPLGNSATYLTVDVPAWISQHLRVRSGRDSWAVSGFSQGGTCAAQLGSAHPDLFGTILDISGEVAPTIGGDTVQAAFNGSQSTYAAAFPAAIMESRAPYPDTAAYFCVGEDDQQYRPEVEQVAAAARAAGMQTSMSLSDGTAHDWGTVQRCVGQTLPSLMQRLGITR